MIFEHKEMLCTTLIKPKHIVTSFKDCTCYPSYTKAFQHQQGIPTSTRLSREAPRDITRTKHGKGALGSEEYHYTMFVMELRKVKDFFFRITQYRCRCSRTHKHTRSYEKTHTTLSYEHLRTMFT